MMDRSPVDSSTPSHLPQIVLCSTPDMELSNTPSAIGRAFVAKGAKLDIFKLKYDPSRVVRIKNLPDTVSFLELEEKCSRYGPITMTHMSKQSSVLNTVIATVVMESVLHAESVIKALDHSVFLGCTISLTLLAIEQFSGNKSYIQPPIGKPIPPRPIPPYPSTTGVPLTKFTCLLMLPVELRLLIWKACLPLSRSVQLECRDEPRNGLPIYPLVRRTFKSRNPVPLCLQIYKESRQEALKVYELAFSVESDRDDQGLPPFRTTYFDFCKDEVYLSFPARSLFINSIIPRPLRLIGNSTLKRIKYLALDYTTHDANFYDRESFTHPSLWNICLPNVERIKLVFNENLSLNDKNQTELHHLNFSQLLPPREYEPGLRDFLEQVHKIRTALADHPKRIELIPMTVSRSAPTWYNSPNWRRKNQPGAGDKKLLIRAIMASHFAKNGKNDGSEKQAIIDSGDTTSISQEPANQSSGFDAQHFTDSRSEHSEELIDLDFAIPPPTSQANMAVHHNAMQDYNLTPNDSTTLNGVMNLENSLSQASDADETTSLIVQHTSTVTENTEVNQYTETHHYGSINNFVGLNIGYQQNEPMILQRGDEEGPEGEDVNVRCDTVCSCCCCWLCCKVCCYVCAGICKLMCCGLPEGEEDA